MRHFSGLVPRTLSPDAASVLDVFRQFERFATSPRAAQERIQAGQLRSLLMHAHAHSPFWRDRLDAAGIEPAKVADISVLTRLPALRRSEIQAQFEAMRARLPGWNDDDITLHKTSGSTALPVMMEKLRVLYATVYQAVMLMDHRWHQRDASRLLGSFTHKVKDTDTGRWGQPMQWYETVGRAFGRSTNTRSIAELYRILQDKRPAYLNTGPTLLRGLAEAARDIPGPAPRIEQFITSTERVDQNLRRQVREVFGARITDRYSSEECGWMALQCPKHDHYHVASMSCVLEVVDDDGRPCAVGQPGRVLVTTLHSYAMPLLRYEVGDMAVRGPDCDCGVTLPVLAEILGRTRELITLPNGERRMVWLNFGTRFAPAGLLEHLVRFYSCGTVELLVRCAAPLSPETREALVERVHEGFGYPFPVVLREVQEPLPPRLKPIEFEKVDRAYAPGA